MSVHENYHPYFSKKIKQLDYFPIGIGKSEYLLVSYLNKEDKNSMIIPSFLGNREKLKISKCLKNLILEKYSLFDDHQFWHGGYLELYRINN